MDNTRNLSPGTRMSKTKNDEKKLKSKKTTGLYANSVKEVAK